MMVEDSNNLRYVLRDYFEILGYDVVDFGDSESAIKAFPECNIDICLLDITLPDKDGFFLMQEIRKMDSEIPVVFLTAKSSKEDKIKGFKLGCDDYITKPFSTEELALRIDAILRRTKNRVKETRSLFEEKVYHFGDFTFNYSTMLLEHPKMNRTLTRKEAELLRLLCEHKNKLLPREVILREIWGEEDYSIGRSMDVFLTKLRSYINIEIDPSQLDPSSKRRRKYLQGYEPKVEIANVHGTGFILKVKEIPEEIK